MHYNGIFAEHYAQPVALLRRHVYHVFEWPEPSGTSEIAIVVAGHRSSCVGSRRAGNAE